MRRDPDDPELVLEKAANRLYMELLSARVNTEGIAVSRSSIWLGTGLPHPKDVEVHPFVGRVALDIDDPAIGQPDFYIGPWHKESGDLVVFSEALTHGTLPWQATHQRRSVLYKYSPGSSSWARQPACRPEVLTDLTDRQRRLCLPPSVAEHPPV